MIIMINCYTLYIDTGDHDRQNFDCIMSDILLHNQTQNISLNSYRYIYIHTYISHFMSNVITFEMKIVIWYKIACATHRIVILDILDQNFIDTVEYVDN